MTPSVYPFDKFLALHDGEEMLRGKSLEAIAASEDLTLHARVIECGQDLVHVLVHAGPPKDDDDLTVRLLGIRVFNSAASALKLLLSGYYQTAAVQIRDMLETAFLLDLLGTDRALIAEWRTSDKNRRLNKFGPAAIRRELDDRDGYTGRKREDTYNLLCELAAHPTAFGFQMLKYDGKNAHCGPFFEEKALAASLAEFAKTHTQAVTNFRGFFKLTSREVGETRLDFMEAHGVWLTRFFGAPDNSAMLAAHRADIAHAFPR